MFFFLSKILLFLLTPITWVFGLALWGILTKKPLRKKRMLWASVIILYFFSNGFIADEFMRAYESETIHYEDVQTKYDAAIVLGGFSSNDPERGMVQFHSATDRLMAGIKLYKTGKVEKLMISSGSGQIMNPNEREALHIKDYLIEIGIPEEDLIIESESKNTHENAAQSAKLLNEQIPNGTFILVTSAVHMPRAKRCFEKEGLTIEPFAVDHQAGPRKFMIDHLFLPNINSMARWQMLLKEWMGFIAYKTMGYC